MGIQANLEHRHVIEREDYAAIIPRLGTIASLGFGEVGAHLDTRFLFFNFGASFGARRVWRTYVTVEEWTAAGAGPGRRRSRV